MGMDWRNRIVGYGTMPASEFLSNPHNWRVHPRTQQAALGDVLEEVGWVQNVIVNRTTGHLIDGHLRVLLAARQGENTPVPVTFVELPEDEERLILAVLDPLAALATADDGVLAELLNDVHTESDALTDLLDGLVGDEEEQIQSMADGVEGEDAEVWEIPPAPDIIFPSDNEFGIPTLDAEMQATDFIAPLGIWGNTKRSARFEGTWAFYTEDYRFERLWKEPGQVVATGAVAAVEPNFSCYAEMPVAVGLYQIYRKRWIARYWQRHGIRVFVDLNVSPHFYEYNMLGVPAGWGAYATRGYSARLEWTEREYEMAQERAGGDVLFLVYGGGKAVQAACVDHGWLWVPEVMTAGKE